MSYKSSSSTSGFGNSITIPPPAGVVAGDRLIALIIADNATNVTITPPSGWVSIGSTAEGGQPDGAKNEVFEVRNATGAESYAFTVSASQELTAMAICLSGRSNTTAATIVTTFNPAANVPPISVLLSGVSASQNADVVALLSLDITVSTDTYSYSAITDYTTRITRNDTWVSAAAFTRDNVNAGGTGDLSTTATRTSGTGNSGYSGFVISIPEFEEIFIPRGNNVSNLVNEGGAGLFLSSSISANTAVAADVNAAVSAQNGLRLMGFSSKESAGVPAAAAFRIINGATGATNSPVINVNHALGTSLTQWFGPDGIACQNGLSIDWISGQVDVELFYKVVT